MPMVKGRLPAVAIELPVWLQREGHSRTMRDEVLDV